jgi:hypothetical protein
MMRDEQERHALTSFTINTPSIVQWSLHAEDNIYFCILVNRRFPSYATVWSFHNSAKKKEKSPGAVPRHLSPFLLLPCVWAQAGVVLYVAGRRVHLSGGLRFLRMCCFL